MHPIVGTIPFQNRNTVTVLHPFLRTIELGHALLVNSITLPLCDQVRIENIVCASILCMCAPVAVHDAARCTVTLVRCIYDSMQLAKGLRNAVARKAAIVPVLREDNSQLPRDNLKILAPPTTSPAPQKLMRISSLALMLVGQRVNQLKFHTRVCGRGGLDRWRVVDVSLVRQQYPATQTCALCCTTDDVVPECAACLPDVPSLQDLNHLVQGLQRLRVADFVVTDLQKTYHTQVHGSTKIVPYIVPTAMLGSNMQGLKPCNICVSSRLSDPVFDGQGLDLDIVRTVDELATAASHCQQQHRQVRTMRNARFQGKAIVHPKRVEKVFLRYPNSHVYHTALHGLAKQSRTIISAWDMVPDKEEGAVEGMQRVCHTRQACRHIYNGGRFGVGSSRGTTMNRGVIKGICVSINFYIFN